ncbi:hypothetical protein KY290_005312 [Solanum tuberosum]|uniref:Aminotransferase-like plant mobile domain-containing protein n=1 Tax=Solanum tuberosum TaxID=4113 RepID=A0ABQ7WDQ6_SOLTU|nr:hypothetical protein KY289_005700 [Solanum tuberosum]KAH0778885.1 hypothetical protein KY290_005312 [Solanum tuberosum]
MMHFRDRDSPHPLLEIVGDDQQNPNAKVLLLEVQPPAIGVFSLVSEAYDKSLLLKEWSKMDTKDVMRNFSSKATSMKVPLLKSTIHHDAASSKSSHSDGSFNNWRVPFSNFGNVCYTPGNGGPNRYAEPPQKVSKVRATKPRLNHNPSGHIDSNFLPRTDEENAPFVELDVEESLRDETNLAAFFACWLCKFVLPNKKVNHVRASVFKVASLMAHGKKFSLAVPVLASIYRGLKEISTSSNLSVANIIFPIHYVYGWLGEYFGTHHRANRSHRSIPLCKISGEKMAKCFNFTDAQKLFQQDDALRLHHLAMLHDSNFIVESYSPIRFSRQFGFCQDVPGDLVERPYDGTLLTLVQLWNSSFRLNTFSKVMIQMCPLEGAPLMTREYVDWWPSQRMNTSQGNLHIILKKTKQDSTSTSSKGASDQSKEKSHPSSKSQVKSNDTLQVAKTSSKSKTSKDGDVPAKSKLRRLTLASKATSPAPEVGHSSSGTNELHVSSDYGNDQMSNLETPCDEISHLYALPDGVGRPNASPSPMDRHWNRPKRKAQGLDDVCCGIDILDTIVIDDNDFVDEDSNSASLFELAKQLDLRELYGGDLNNGAVADFTVDLNDLDAAAKDFHSSINDDQPSLEVVPPRKSPSNDVMPSLEVVPPRKSPCRPLRPGAPTLEPQETIYRAKSTFVSEMWGALCGWITQFSLGSSDGFTELESSISSTLEEIRKVNIIDVSSLEDHVENFFKSYTEYDTLRSSKMTKESHEKALSDAQRRLDGAKLAHEKLDGSMDKLQATLVDVEKDLKALTSKKKKVTALINKYQEKLSRSQENVTITEGEIYTIEANNVMSNDEVERLAKLEGAVEKSRQEIISFKLFP